MPPKKGKAAKADSEKKDEAPDKNYIIRKELKPQYEAFCKAYVTDPIPVVIKRINEGNEKSKDIQQVKKYH